MFAHWWISFSGFEWCFQFWTYNSLYWDYLLCIIPSITKFKMKSAAGSKDVLFPLRQPQAPLNQHLITCRQSVIKPKHPKTPYTATSRSQLEVAFQRGLHFICTSEYAQFKKVQFWEMAEFGHPTRLYILLTIQSDFTGKTTFRDKILENCHHHSSLTSLTTSHQSGSRLRLPAVVFDVLMFVFMIVLL